MAAQSPEGATEAEDGQNSPARGLRVEWQRSRQLDTEERFGGLLSWSN
jgi:hypothetical protein